MEFNQITETPAPNSMARNQIYQLPSSRPRDEDREHVHSPVPYQGMKGIKATRKSPAKGLRQKSLTANLKENTGPRKSAGRGPKAMVLGVKNPNCQNPKRRGEPVATQLAKSNSIISLASAFQSHPSSPLSYCSSPKASKRALVDISVHPNISRHESADPRGLKLQRLSLPATAFEGQQSGRSLSGAGSPTCPRKGDQSPARLVRKGAVYGLKNLPRRPSHPTLPSGPRRSLSRKFAPRSALESVDFDRPPSQLSMYDLRPLSMAEGSEGDGSAHEQNNFKLVPFEEFEAGSFEISTPQGLLELTSDLTQPSATIHSTPPRQSMENQCGIAGSIESKRTESMSLTSVEDAQQVHYDLTDRSPWVSDSLISPPTIYLNRHRAQAPLCSCTDSGGDEHREERPNAMGLQPPLEIIESTSKMAVGRTRSGTVTQIRPSQATDTSAPLGRTRSGTITQETFKSATPLLIDLALVSNKTRRDSNLAPSISRTRSDTIRPAVIARTPAGALVGLQALPGPGALVSEVSLSRTPEEVLEPVPLDDQGLFDTEFDPNPEDLLVFSSAKNPDVEDLDSDVDEDHATRPARPYVSLEPDDDRHDQVSVDGDTLNLGTDIAHDMSPIRDDFPTRPAASKPRQIKIRWVAPPSKPGKGKDKENRRPTTGPKSSRGFKHALGLGRGNVSSNSKGKGVLDGRSAEDECSPHQSPASSTDPIDFLSPLDDEPDRARSTSPDVRTVAPAILPANDKEKGPRRKSFSARLEGMVPGKT